MSKGKHKDYSKQHRIEYNKRFEDAYGMSHIEWSKWKKQHTKAEVHEKRLQAQKRRNQKRG